MRRFALIAATVAAVVVPAVTVAAVEPAPAPSAISPGTTPANPCPNPQTQAAFRDLVRKVYRRPRISRAARDRLARWQRCARSPKATRNMRAEQRRQGQARRARAEAERLARSLTPYVCARGRYAIPCYILDCESYGGKWSALNSIGAKGPYQFLGKDHLIPWPVRTAAHRLAHHRLAARLWAGGAGRSHWQQCL